MKNTAGKADVILFGTLVIVVSAVLSSLALAGELPGEGSGAAAGPSWVVGAAGNGAPAAAHAQEQYEPLTEEMITEEMVARGNNLFHEGSCHRCHMEGGAGSSRAPALTDDEWLHSDGSLEGIRATIVKGVSEDEMVVPDRPYPMYPMGRMDLDEDELNALTAYVWRLSQGG